MRHIALTFLALALITVGHAQKLFGDIGVEFAPAVNGEYLVGEACATLGFRGEIGEGFFPDAAYRAELHGCYDALTGSGSVQLGETRLTVYLDDVDVRVGNQTVSWGSMSVFNPVDVVNAKNLSNPVADPQEAKLPSPMVRVDYYADAFSVQALVIPVYRKMVTPSDVWPVAVPAIGEPPAGGLYVFDPTELADLDFAGSSELSSLFVSEHVPEFSLANTQFGVRVNVPVNVLDGGDINASYYRGFRHEPHVSFTPVPVSGPLADTVRDIVARLPLSEAEKQQILGMLNVPALQQALYIPLPEIHYTPIHMFGVDFSAVTGSWVLRGEAAFELSADATGEDPALGNNRFSVALGAETMLPGNAVVFAEVGYTHDFADRGRDNQVQAVQTALGGNYEFTNRLTAQGAWVHEWTSGGGVIQPSITYQLADGLQAHASAAVFYGPAHTQYGLWSKQSHVNIGVTYRF